jgi:hypothetical protein
VQLVKYSDGESEILYIKDLLQKDLPAEGKSSLGDEDVPDPEDIEPAMDDNVCCLL